MGCRNHILAAVEECMDPSQYGRMSTRQLLVQEARLETCSPTFVDHVHQFLSVKTRGVRPHLLMALAYQSLDVSHSCPMV